MQYQFKSPVFTAQHRGKNILALSCSTHSNHLYLRHSTEGRIYLHSVTAPIITPCTHSVAPTGILAHTVQYREKNILALSCSTPTRLLAHMVQHREKNILALSCSTPTRLLAHMVQHREKNILALSCSTPTRLLAHMVQHREKNILALSCSTPTRLLAHMVQHREKNILALSTCDIQHYNFTLQAGPSEDGDLALSPCDIQHYRLHFTSRPEWRWRSCTQPVRYTALQTSLYKQARVKMEILHSARAIYSTTDFTLHPNIRIIEYSL